MAWGHGERVHKACAGSQPAGDFRCMGSQPQPQALQHTLPCVEACFALSKSKVMGKDSPVPVRSPRKTPFLITSSIISRYCIREVHLGAIGQGTAHSVYPSTPPTAPPPHPVSATSSGPRALPPPCTALLLLRIAFLAPVPINPMPGNPRESDLRSPASPRAAPPPPVAVTARQIPPAACRRGKSTAPHRQPCGIASGAARLQGWELFPVIPVKSQQGQQVFLLLQHASTLPAHAKKPPLLTPHSRGAPRQPCKGGCHTGCTKKRRTLTEKRTAAQWRPTA